MKSAQSQDAGALRNPAASLATIAIIIITFAAFTLRLAYLLNSHPFIDEFITVLAAQAILQRGLPILPSGMFYEHGIAFTYLAAPFVALANQNNLFTIARLPSLIIGTATVPFIYWIGRRWFTPWVGLFAAALLAFSPEGMVWGGRARMYALTQLLILLLVWLVYEGSVLPSGKTTTRKKTGGTPPKPPGLRRYFQDRSRLRWWALLVLLLALLAQFGTLMFIPPLIVGIIVIVWRSRNWRERPFGQFLRAEGKVWLWQGLGLVAVIALAMLVKRLGQPIGMAQLGAEAAANPLIELWRTVAYQIGLALDAESALKFLARQFGVPHHLWLTVTAALGLALYVLDYELRMTNYESQIDLEPKTQHPKLKTRNSKLVTQNLPYLFLWLVFGLMILEMITLLEPFRRNPRYVVMGLPLFYLIVAESLSFVIRHSSFVIRHSSFVIRHSSFVIRHSSFYSRYIANAFHCSASARFLERPQHRLPHSGAALRSSLSICGPTPAARRRSIDYEYQRGGVIP